MLSYFRNVKGFKKYLMQGLNLFGLTKEYRILFYFFLLEKEEENREERGDITVILGSESGGSGLFC